MAIFRCLTCVLLFCTVSLAADKYYSVPVGDITIAPDAQWPNGSAESLRWRSPRVVIAGGGEAYFDTISAAARLLIRVDSEKALAGTIYFASPLPARAQAPTALPFTAKAQGDDAAKNGFYRAKAQHYRNLQNLDLAGSAWFRHLADQAGAQLPPDANSVPQNTWQQQRATRDLYDLFSGGRAISENLQLDRDLRGGAQGGPDVAVDTIPGITVAEMDFKALLGNRKPTLDALSSMVPIDQYAVFFPTAAAMFEVMDKVDQAVIPITDSLMPGGEDAGIAKRYERQLGLERTAIGRMIIGQSVKSIVITGSDPFFPLGTDVALVFETENPGALAALINTQVATAASKLQVRPETIRIADLSVAQYRSADRAISSYVAVFPKAVVVANSPAQIGRIAEAASKPDGSIASALEYQYFRAEYAANEPESMLAILPDAAIRKWCSARWRIGDARRIQARARMLDQIASAISAKAPATPADAVYGSRDFSTPISELELSAVTASEAAAYKQWRDNYQRNWRGAFDPIAVRLHLSGTTIAADVMVLPLIASSDYRQFIDVTRNSQLDPTSGDPHDTLLHFVMSIDRESAPLKQLAVMSDSMTGMKIDLLGWLGKSVAIYADDDPFWDEVIGAERAESFVEKNADRLPLALRVDSTSPFKLAAFLATVRTKIEQSAPGLTVWENREHAGKPYLRVSGSEGAGTSIAVYYAALPDSLTITTSEALLKRALERAAAKAPADPVNPWLGKNVGLKIHSDAVNLLRSSSDPRGQALARASWRNIPILNEWKRLSPAEDPVAFHERAWGTRLVCPAGGKYVWNEATQTMQSTVAGTAEAPLPIPPQLVKNAFSVGDFGLTFENGGLRARMSLDTSAPKPRKPSTRPATTQTSARVLPKDDVKVCQTNLMRIGQGIMLYENDHKGVYPDTLAQLVEEQMAPVVFLCPAHVNPPAIPSSDGAVSVAQWIQKNSDYVYLGKGKPGKNDADVILVYENPPRHGEKIPVLFGDGHVTCLTPAQLKEQLPPK